MTARRWSDAPEQTPEQTKAQEKHAEKMKAALVDDRPPYCSGTIAVDPKDLILYFGNEENAGYVEGFGFDVSETSLILRA